MKHWKVDWLHDFQEEPTRLYSEIDDTGYEVRKIQHYRDGRQLKADAFHETGEIGLSEIPMGNIEDVAAQPEFAAHVIDEEEFELAWRDAVWSTPHATGPARSN